MRFNNKGFGVTEVLVAITIFTMTYISINSIVLTNNTTYLTSKIESKIVSSYSEIFGFLYTYKENFGTYMFKNKIGYDPSMCNYTIDDSSNGDGWCLAYPYYVLENGYNNIYFQNYNNDIDLSNLETNGTKKGIYLLETATQDLSSLHLFLRNNGIKSSNNKQILIFYKKDNNSQDLFYFDIRYLNYYAGNQKIIFEKQFTLY